MKKRTVDLLNVWIFDTREEMGKAAGISAEKAILEAIAKKGEARVIFAAAPSQNEILATLVESKVIDWSKVVAFHMDEYMGLAPNATQRFSQFLQRGIFEKLPFKKIHLLSGTMEDCAAYEALLKEAAIDLVCLGIGENGHLAFNDPPVADFSDPVWVKPVELDSICRTQQVNDGCFESIEKVPTHAVTLTIPALLSAEKMVCVVPGPTKSQAVRATLEGEVSVSCPASILRRHPQSELYLDREAYQDVVD